MTTATPSLRVLDADTYANGDPTTFGLPLELIEESQISWPQRCDARENACAETRPEGASRQIHSGANPLHQRLSPPRPHHIAERGISGQQWSIPSRSWVNGLAATASDRAS